MSDLHGSWGVLRAPDEVLFGPGTFRALPRVVQLHGRRAFVCADPFISTLEPFQAAVSRVAASGLAVRVCTSIEAGLPAPGVEEMANQARDFSTDVVVGIGGGSALDSAKLVALLLAHRGRLREYYGENQVPSRVRPVVAVPTTAGTGSEVSPVAVLSDADQELKVGVSSPFLIPRVALVDPLLSLGAPASVTAYAGIDALVHAVEAFTSARREHDWAAELPVFVGRNQMSSLFALEAIRLIGLNLARAVRQPHDLSSHEAMAYGSLLAGLAFGSAGTHLSHALQYPIGSLSQTPHGLGTGMLLPYVLRACHDKTRPELAAIGGALGISAGTEEHRAEATIKRIAELTAEVGVARPLSDLGVKREQIPRLAELALTVRRLANNSTIHPSQQAFEEILETAYAGPRT